MRRWTLALAAVLVLIIVPALAHAQASVSATFRYRPVPGATVVRAFVPGSFNNWGPNSNGAIAINAPSQMQYVDSLAQYMYRATLQVGTTYQYKIHVHQNTSGTSYAWLSDPLNPIQNPNDNNNSVLAVTDPMLFQPAHEQDASGNVVALSASFIGTLPFTTVTLDLNGQEIDARKYFNPATGIFRYVPVQPITTSLSYRISATDDQGRTISYEAFVPINVQVTNVSRPSGLRDGITYDGNRVTLSLLAPRKKFVYVIGDFNDWKIDPNYLMKRDSTAKDSVWWWISLDGLESGKEYGFQYLVDGNLRVADPYAEKVLDPANDSYITSQTYPGLKPYPTGKTSEYVSVLQPGRTPYAWQVPQFNRPEKKDLVIYELLVRDFLAAHDYKTLADTLDYLQRLGVNALELMPVTEFDGNLSWGYNPAFYFAPDKYYGPADQLRRLVDEAHKRGMAVVLDLVLNHSYGQHPLVRLYQSSTGAPAADNLWYNTSCPHQPYCWGADFNHQSTATRYFVDRVNRYWLSEYNVDGFRFDFTKGFTNLSTGSAYDATRIANLKRMADRIWEQSPGAYVILEHFADNSEEKVLSDYGMMLWGNLNSNYNEAAMGYHESGKSDLSWGYYKLRGWTQPNLVTYMESHDEERLMFKNLQYGKSSGTYNVRELQTALERMKMAGAFFFTLPGPKMIWQFGELGYDVSIETNGRTGEKPIRWNYRADPNRFKLYQTWKELLRLRRENEVFTSPQTVATLSVSGAVKTIKLSHPTMDVVVVGNFDVIEQTAQVTFPRTGTWYRFFEDDSMDLTAADAAIKLEPGQFFIYTTVKQAAPERGLITVDIEDQIPAGVRLKLHQNYPNPASRDTKLVFTLPEAGDVRIDLYDMLGRRIAGITDRAFSRGTHEVSYDVSGLAPGVYFYRMKAGDTVLTGRMSVAR